jgi:hypothetical protein
LLGISKLKLAFLAGGRELQDRCGLAMQVDPQNALDGGEHFLDPLVELSGDGAKIASSAR